MTTIIKIQLKLLSFLIVLTKFIAFRFRFVYRLTCAINKGLSVN
jgi:hypothetical protein